MREMKFRGISIEDHNKGQFVYGMLNTCIGKTVIRQRELNGFSEHEKDLNIYWILVSEKPSDVGWRISDTFTAVKIVPESLGEFIGLKDNRNNRDVYESDIYFEEDAQDDGDRRLYFVITWIRERCAFSMLEISEYHSYINKGFDAIERDFDGFYFEITQDSIDKMHYAGNIHQNPELL